MLYKSEVFMFYKIKLKLQSNNKITYHMSSLFHGFLMEKIKDKTYIEYLHKSQLHTYNQHLEYNNQDVFWVLNFLDEESYNKIWLESLSSIDSIYLKKNNLTAQIIDKNIQLLTKKELNDIFNEKITSKYITIKFLTPTAFKSQEKYIFFPDLNLIYKSIMKKYDAANDNDLLYDEDVLNDLVKYTYISDYNLKTIPFYLEGIKVKAFIGTITIKTNGADTLISFIKTLFAFAEFCCVGIKCSLGMGSIEIIN